ncbi:MAG: 4Fe-4S binding protein [ANME-2 cluster archaeon]|jgi:4Fe-4S ferredoxin|nr:4Fe-4S binding protein [ANME-2 cluster archaeon]
MAGNSQPDPVDGGLEVIVEMDIQDTHFIYTQTTDGSKKTLDYDYKRCNGCGICIEICPVKTIEAGPLLEIATGMDAPPVIIDQTKCTFCGMCASFCPVRALKMDIDGEDILEMEDYPRLDSKVVINEKCLPCLLCEKACPEEAMKLELTIPTKEEVAPFKEGQHGEISVDMDKCNFCGLCAPLCPAFVLVERKPTPDNPVPFQDLLVDLDKCDYCKICEDFCPEGAIKVKGKLEAEVPLISGTLTIDENKCTRCGWCREVCPYDAVEIMKPFEGDIELIEKNLVECDPMGCHGCFNVCPAHAWYVPPDKKIDVVKDLCIYCGACEKACHVRAIDVDRTGVKHTQVRDLPWSAQWNDAIDTIYTGQRTRPDTARRIEMEAGGVPRPEVHEIATRKGHEHLDEIRSRLDDLLPMLEDAKVRFEWEKNHGGSVRKRVKKLGHPEG